MVFTLFVVAPYEILAGNQASLTYGLADAWQVFVLPAIVMVAIGTIVLTLMRGNLFNLVALVVFGIGLATYIQVAFLNGTLPSADGATIDWTQYKTVTLGTLIVWLAVCIGPWAVSNLNRKLTQNVCALVAAALVLVQAVGVGSLFVNAYSFDGNGVDSDFYYAKTPYKVTTEGLYTVSEKKNVIVFVLDMYDTNDLTAALNEKPDLLNEMTGFTWYQNDLAAITPTREAIPSLLTAQSPVAGESFFDYQDSRYKKGNYIGAIDDAGYSVGAYSDSLPSTLPYFMKHLINAKTSDEMRELNSVNVEGTLKSLWMCSMFRDLPWALKPFFWFYTDDINQAMTNRESSENALTPYTIDDATYYQELINIGLSATDDGEKGAFRFIHLMGAHYPYTLDENSQLSSGVTRVQQSIGSMNIVSEYIRQLKALNLYDNATIIITADHGYFASTEPFALLDEAVTPIMMVKPAENADVASAPLQTSNQPVCNIDALPTAVADMGDVDAPTNGTNILTQDNANRTRYFCSLSKDANQVEHGYVQYEVQGDANDIDNWTPTGWILNFDDDFTWEYRGNG